MSKNCVVCGSDKQLWLRCRRCLSEWPVDPQEIKHFGPLDKIEQEQVKKALLDRPFHPVLYRGFEVVTSAFDGYVDYEASRDNHEWSFVAPNLPALLHIIWLITKDNP